MRKAWAGMIGVVVIAAGFTLANRASAAAFTVSNTDDAGPGSLRQAIIDSNANANSGTVDVITITATGTIQLATALPTIVEPLEINGPGANTLTIRRNVATAFQILRADPVTSFTLRAVTVANGLFGDGAGINSSATTTLLERVAVVGNTSTQGPTAAGGGVFATALTVRQSTISGNNANGVGGGIASGALVLENSTISGNTAGLNQANTPGGGVRASSGTVITSSTFVNNVTNGPGENLEVTGPSTLKNTLLQGGGGNGCAGALTSEGFNLADDATCGLTQPTDQPSTDAQLGALANNGGPTQTHALPLTSPAVDQGQSDALTEDQRRFTRPVDIASIANAAGGNAADIGAYEVQPADNAPPQTTIVEGPGSPSSDTTPTFRFISDEANSTFECAIDAGAFAACESPFTTPVLTAGAHTFRVRAIDPSGNVDPTPDAFDFTIDLTAPVPPPVTPPGTPPVVPPSPTGFPETVITSKAFDKTRDKTPTFTFASSEVAAFACSVDGAAFEPCASPHTLIKLALGTHTFAVRAIDVDGNTDPTPATQTFDVKRKKHKNKNRGR